MNGETNCIFLWDLGNNMFHKSNMIFPHNGGSITVCGLVSVWRVGDDWYIYSDKNFHMDVKSHCKQTFSSCVLRSRTCCSRVWTTMKECTQGINKTTTTLSWLLPPTPHPQYIIFNFPYFSFTIIGPTRHHHFKLTLKSLEWCPQL